MAKDAHDREDLLRDATAFCRRIEIRVPESAETIFCGFRANDALSLFWGQATVVQFNVDGEIRRAFWRERMVATYRRKLHWLESSEGTGRVRLSRIEFTESESLDFQRQISYLLQNFAKGNHVSRPPHPRRSPS